MSCLGCHCCGKVPLLEKQDLERTKELSTVRASLEQVEIKLRAREATLEQLKAELKLTKSQQQETKQPKSGEKDNENATLKQKVKELQADKARLDTANANALKKLEEMVKFLQQLQETKAKCKRLEKELAALKQKKPPFPSPLPTRANGVTPHTTAPKASAIPSSKKAPPPVIPSPSREISEPDLVADLGDAFDSDTSDSSSPVNGSMSVPLSPPPASLDRSPPIIPRSPPPASLDRSTLSPSRTASPATSLPAFPANTAPTVSYTSISTTAVPSPAIAPASPLALSAQSPPLASAPTPPLPSVPTFAPIVPPAREPSEATPPLFADSRILSQLGQMTHTSVMISPLFPHLVRPEPPAFVLPPALLANEATKAATTAKESSSSTTTATAAPLTITASTAATTIITTATAAATITTATGYSAPATIAATIAITPATATAGAPIATAAAAVSAFAPPAIVSSSLSTPPLSIRPGKSPQFPPASPTPSEAGLISQLLQLSHVSVALSPLGPTAISAPPPPPHRPLEAAILSPSRKAKMNGHLIDELLPARSSARRKRSEEKETQSTKKKLKASKKTATSSLASPRASHPTSRTITFPPFPLLFDELPFTAGTVDSAVFSNGVKRSLKLLLPGHDLVERLEFILFSLERTSLYSSSQTLEISIVSDILIHALSTQQVDSLHASAVLLCHLSLFLSNVSKPSPPSALPAPAAMPSVENDGAVLATSSSSSALTASPKTSSSSSSSSSSCSSSSVSVVPSSFTTEVGGGGPYAQVFSESFATVQADLELPPFCRVMNHDSLVDTFISCVVVILTKAMRSGGVGGTGNGEEGLSSESQTSLAKLVALICLQQGRIHRLRVFCAELVVSCSRMPVECVAAAVEVWPELLTEKGRLFSQALRVALLSCYQQRSSSLSISSSSSPSSAALPTFLSSSSSSAPSSSSSSSPFSCSSSTSSTSSSSSSSSSSPASESLAWDCLFRLASAPSTPSLLQAVDLCVTALVADTAYFALPFQPDTLHGGGSVEALLALQLFACSQGFLWTNNVLIRKVLWRKLCSCESVEVLPSLLTALGVLGSTGVAYVAFSPIVEDSLRFLRETLTNFLTSSFPLSVQLAAALGLLSLAGDRSAYGPVSRWFSQLHTRDKHQILLSPRRLGVQNVAFMDKILKTHTNADS